MFVGVVVETYHELSESGKKMDVLKCEQKEWY